MAEPAGPRPGDVRIGRWLFDGTTPLPTFVLRETALAHDIALLADWCRARGVSFAPHGKTPMAPAIFRRQLAAGAWGITLAHTGQAAIGVESGVPRIVIANEVVDDQGLAWIGDTLETSATELFVLADAVTGVERMAARLRGRRRALPVLVDVGITGGRTGVRSVDQAAAVAHAIDDAAPSLRLAGVSIYEGVVGGTTIAERVAAVRAMGAMAREVVGRLGPLFDRAAVDEIVVTGGGSQYLDVVVEELTRPWPGRLPVRVVVRSGAYVTHDHGLYERVSPFGANAPAGGPRLQPAIEVWAPVVSVPEPGLAIVGAGRRDLPIDQDLPVIIKRRGRDGAVRASGPGLTVTKLNDQHAFVSMGDGAVLEVGDLVAFGISHPCTAFQLWREALVVDDDDRIVDVYELHF